jgi:uncharacterized protein DUF5320
MPNQNGMGPNGQGPRTGRGLGPCEEGTGQGCGRQNGNGRGRGLFGNGSGRGFFGRLFSRNNNQASLEDREKMLEEELQAIREEKANLKDQ